MATLTENKNLVYEVGTQNSLPVVADDVIYQGAAVGDNASGLARPLVAADPFRGFAVAKADNAGGLAGDVRVVVNTIGKIETPVVGVTGVADVGSAVYMSDDDTFTLTSTSNSLVGKVVRHVSGTTVIVAFKSDETP